LKLISKNSKIYQIELPCEKEIITKLKIGDLVSLNGIIVTGRDSFHKYAVEKYIKGNIKDNVLEKLNKILKNSFIYHCGPVIKKEANTFEFLAGGPTTSIREEPYEYQLIPFFSLNGVIGKGGMGKKTQSALQEHKAVYLHTTGGAAALIGEKVTRVCDVLFIEFGIPEAVWILEVKNFNCIVTMDANGESLHEKVYNKSYEKFRKLIQF